MNRGWRILRWALKLSLAVAILAWMIRGGRLDLGQLPQAARSWPYLLAIAGICYVMFLLTAIRWRWLMASQEVALSLWKAFSLTMIGGLFSTVIPGAVSGDVVKAYYVGANVPDRRTRAITTILVDRIVGMLGLLVLSALAGLANYDAVRGAWEVKVFCWTVVGAALCCAGGLIVAVVASRWAVDRAHQIAGRFRFFSVAEECSRALAVFQGKPSVLVIALGISLSGQVMLCLAFYLAGHALGFSSFGFLPFLWIVPLGLVSMAIPIAPAGLGIGQMAFYTLFQFVHPGSGNLGSSTSVVYHAIYIAVSLSGVVFYLLEPDPAKMKRKQ